MPFCPCVVQVPKPGSGEGFGNVVGECRVGVGLPGTHLVLWGIIGAKEQVPAFALIEPSRFVCFLTAECVPAVFREYVLHARHGNGSYRTVTGRIELPSFVERTNPPSVHFHFRYSLNGAGYAG